MELNITPSPDIPARSGSRQTEKQTHRLSNVDIENKKATCSICGPDTNIRIRGTTGRGRNAPLKICETSYRASYRSTNRASQKHGMTMNEAAEYLKGKVCKLCGKDYDLAVDHDPVTMKLRGALCRSHNVAIGALGDTAENLIIVLQYLNGEELTGQLPRHRDKRLPQ